MRRSQILSLLSTVVITAVAAVSVPTTVTYAGDGSKGFRAHNNKSSNGVYIVRMSDEPAAAYTGKVRGYGATRPAEGEKLEASRPEVASYRGYLQCGDPDAVARVGGRQHHRSGPGFK